MRKLVVMILTLAVGTFARQPKKTEMKGHALHETVAEYFGADRVQTCTSRPSRPKVPLWKKDKEEMECEEIKKALSGEKAEFFFPLQGTKPSDPLHGDPCDFDGKAIFTDGALTEIDICTDQPFAIVLSQLTEKYGKPTHLSEETVQNGYGATWPTSDAIWLMPDKTQISAWDNVTFTRLGLVPRYRRYSFVVFHVQGSPAQQKANPFDKEAPHK